MRVIKSLLLVLAISVFAETASAYAISVVETSSGPYAPGDTLTVDVMLDSEGEEFYGFVLYVTLDWDVMWGDQDASVRHPIPGEQYGYFYYYPGYWYISSFRVDGPMGPVNQSIATLVFHVTDVPNSAWIVPTFDYEYAGFADGNREDVTDEVTLTGLHVPEPTPTMPLGSALGLLGVLYAVRRRRQAA